MLGWEGVNLSGFSIQAILHTYLNDWDGDMEDHPYQCFHVSEEAELFNPSMRVPGTWI